MTEGRGRCRSCGAEVIWAIHERTGKTAPIDARPVPDGSIVLLPLTMFGETPYRILGLAERTTPGDNDRYTPHYQTCPDARRYREQGGDS